MTFMSYIRINRSKLRKRLDILRRTSERISHSFVRSNQFLMAHIHNLSTLKNEEKEHFLNDHNVFDFPLGSLP